MRIILLGAPGAGKGTVSEVISEKIGMPTISTGDIIRAALKNGTPLGLRAKEYVVKGELVPDAIVIDIIRERLAASDCANGYVLDGFPRTIVQAQELEDMGIHIDKVINLEVPDEMIEERLAGRRVCKGCGTTYHVDYKPPRAEGVCDKCGGVVEARADDALETVKKRLKVYHDQTEPLKEFYGKLGRLVMIDGRDGTKAALPLILKELEA